MEDGLMGEFAKGKIEEVVKLLKSKRKLSKKNQEFCQNIISIIGEPILQRTLEHQLNQKVNPNETELEKLEREQKEIQEKIDNLKSSNHEKD
jgi:cell division protein FtsB